MDKPPATVRPAKPAAKPTVSTTFIVEGLLGGEDWRPWGVWEDGGRPLNPANSIEEARDLLEDFNEYREGNKTAWTDSRIIKQTVTREVVS